MKTYELGAQSPLRRLSRWATALHAQGPMLANHRMPSSNLTASSSPWQVSQQRNRLYLHRETRSLVARAPDDMNLRLASSQWVQGAIQFLVTSSAGCMYLLPSQFFIEIQIQHLIWIGDRHKAPTPHASALAGLGGRVNLKQGSPHQTQDAIPALCQMCQDWLRDICHLCHCNIPFKTVHSIPTATKAASLLKVWRLQGTHLFFFCFQGSQPCVSEVAIH